jgi:hypothetical protein
MSNLQKTKGILKAFSPIYSAYCNHYRGLFTPGRDADKATHCKYWIDEISNSNLLPDELFSISEAIKSSRQYSGKPPSPSQFISYGLAMRNSANTNVAGNLSFENEFSLIFNNMRERYKYLWDRSQDNTESSTYKFWLSELESSELPIEYVKKAFSMVPKISLYINYPPSIDDITLMIRIMMSGKDIPLVHDALEIALKRGNVVHPIISYCRYAFDIRKANKKDINKRFNELYADSVMRYLDGSLKLDNFQKKDNVIEKDESLSSEDLIKNLDELLKNL